MKAEVVTNPHARTKRAKIISETPVMTPGRLAPPPAIEVQTLKSGLKIGIPVAGTVMLGSA